MVDEQAFEVCLAAHARKIQDPDVAGLEEPDFLTTTRVVTCGDEGLKTAEPLVDN